MLGQVIKAILMLIEEILNYRQRARIEKVAFDLSQEKLAELFELAAKRMRGEIIESSQPSKNMQDEMDNDTL